MTNSQRGMTLASVLMVGAMGLVLAFSLVGTSFSHLNTASHVACAAVARNQAESAIARTLEELFRQDTFGSSGADSETVVIPSVTEDAKDVGIVTFSARVAARERVPCSVFNLDKDTSKTGYNRRPLPPNSVQLIATGRCKTRAYRIEAVYYIPPFPYVIASSGPVKAREGSLLVAALESLADFPMDGGPIDLKKLKPAHLASNGLDTETDKAVTLGSQARITGNVRSAGLVDIEPEAVVLGEVMTGSDPLNIPKLRAQDYDPEALGRDDVAFLPAGITAPGPTQPYKLSGYQKFKPASPGQALTVNGDLMLDGAQVYVDGDLVVRGGVSGKGALIVTGKTVIQDGGRVSSDNVTALIGVGGVELQGRGADKSSFQGLVYTEGNFRADSISVVGAFVANGTSQTATEIGRLELTNTQMLQLPSYTKLDIPVKVPPPPPAPPPQAVPGPDWVANLRTDNATTLGQSRGGNLDPGLLQGPYFVGVWPIHNAIESFRDPNDPRRYRPELVTADNTLFVSFGVATPVWTQFNQNYPQARGILASDPRFAFAGPAVNAYASQMVDKMKTLMSQHNARYPPIQPTPYGDAAPVGSKYNPHFQLDLNKMLRMQDKLRVLLYHELPD